jgi:hypothetical protein
VIKRKLNPSPLGIQLSNPPQKQDITKSLQSPQTTVETKPVVASPRGMRIEEEKNTLILIQRNEIVIKKMPDGESLLENQFYNLEDCILEL